MNNNKHKIKQLVRQIAEITISNLSEVSIRRRNTKNGNVNIEIVLYIFGLVDN